MFPPGFTHERLDPLWGLLATVHCAFYCLTRLAHKQACQLAHDFRFRFIVDSDGELQSVPAVLFAIIAPALAPKSTQPSRDLKRILVLTHFDIGGEFDFRRDVLFFSSTQYQSV